MSARPKVRAWEISSLCSGDPRRVVRPLQRQRDALAGVDDARRRFGWLVVNVRVIQPRDVLDVTRADRWESRTGMMRSSSRNRMHRECDGGDAAECAA